MDKCLIFIKVKQIICGRFISICVPRVSMAMLFLLPIAYSASSAPSQALNKSVRLSFTLSAPAKGSDGSTINAVRNVQQKLYISSQGRIFERSDRQENRNTGSRERAPTESRFRLGGNQLVGTFEHVSGATRIIVTFDSDFRTCSANLVTGAESGKSEQGKGLNGIVYTATGKPTYSNVSCSITEGNAFSE